MILLRLSNATENVSRVDETGPQVAFWVELLQTGVSERDILERLLGGDNSCYALLYFFLECWSSAGRLKYELYHDSELLAVYEPMAEHGRLRDRALGSGRYALSRFAYIRRDGPHLLLESPKVPGKVYLSSAKSLSIALVNGVVYKPGASSAENELAVLLVRTGFFVTYDMENSENKYWEFHDLLFHSRSRDGRHNYPAGGTFRFGPEAPPPDLRTPEHSASISLPTVSENALFNRDSSLLEIQNHRRSFRNHSSRPLTQSQLSEFLYRSARVLRRLESIHVPTPRGVALVDFALRPYPSGGALFEIDFNICIQHCTDVPAGLYRYDPLGHRLLRLADSSSLLNGMFQKAAWCVGGRWDQLHTLIVLSARIERMMWKYEGAAYAAILKNVGVIIHNMYLHAAAMRLAGCANGQGDSDLFSKLSGLNYYEEPSVGEFVLGALDGDSPNPGQGC